MKNSGEFPKEYYPLNNTDTDNAPINAEPQESNRVLMMKSMSQIMDIGFLLFISYVVTFAVFPGVVISPSLL